MHENAGWHNKEAVSHYKNVVDVVVPGRKEILNTIARLTVEFGKENLNILDIGCGYGEVTAEILKVSPDSAFCLVDNSDEMIKLSNARFSDNKKIELFNFDLNIGLPYMLRNKQFDVVVSCFSLHHVEYENRVRLYSDIYKVLKPGCLFINGDMFRCDSQVINDWEFDNWITWMVNSIKENFGQNKTFDEVKQKQVDNFEKMGDKPGTLWDMYNDLKQAGFRHVDCMLKILNLAVIVATK